MSNVPAIVMALAARVPQHGPLPPQPVAWKEYPGEWVIAFEDGRKLRFIREPEPSPSQPGPAGQAPNIANAGDMIRPNVLTQKKGKK